MKKILLISLMIISVIFVSGCVQQEMGKYEIDYYNNTLTFNSNLQEAKYIPVYPDNATLKDTLLGYSVAGVQFVYYKNDTEAPYYAKSLVSFASKYTKMNKIMWNYNMNGKITSVILNNTNQYPNATVEDPAIMLYGPAFTNETKIVVDGHVVKVYAKDLSLRQGKYAQYTDFDLAMDKIILVLAD